MKHHTERQWVTELFCLHPDQDISLGFDIDLTHHAESDDFHQQLLNYDFDIHNFLIMEFCLNQLIDHEKERLRGFDIFWKYFSTSP